MSCLTVRAYLVLAGLARGDMASPVPFQFLAVAGVDGTCRGSRRSSFKLETASFPVALVSLELAPGGVQGGAAGAADGGSSAAAGIGTQPKQ